MLLSCNDINQAIGGPSMRNIGFLGTGAMGSRMAKNIISAGYTLTVYNRTVQKTDPLVALGARVAATPAEAVRGQDAVIAMVSHDQASHELWLDPKVLLALPASCVCIDCSTLSYQGTLALAQGLAKGQRQFLEAPVIGTLPQAEQKQLVALVAGDRQVFERAEPLLQAFTGKQFYFPHPGQGAALKLVNNGLFSIQTTAFAEAYATLTKIGFAEQQVHGILSQLPITSPGMQAMLGLIHERRFAPLFPVDLAEKDLAYAETLMQEFGLEPYLVGATRKTFLAGKQQGLGRLNISGIAQLYGVKPQT
jgi:3-hydroxyisobutyrate dehydrogenase